MQANLRSVFSTIPCFATAEPRQQNELEQLCSVQRYAPAEHVFVYGDPGDALYLVAEGETEVFTHNNAGREIVLEVLGVGTIFGEVALFGGETRAANVRAVQPTVLLCIARSDVPAVLALCPALTEALLGGMARRLRASGDQLRHLTTFDINAMKQKQQTAFDRICIWIVDGLSGVPFLVALIAGIIWWCVIRPFNDSDLSLLSLTLGVLSLLVTLLVLLGQKRVEKSTSVADAEESLAIRQAAKELQFLHEKLDAALSRTVPPS